MFGDFFSLFPFFLAQPIHLGVIFLRAKLTVDRTGLVSKLYCEKVLDTFSPFTFFFGRVVKGMVVGFSFCSFVPEKRESL